MVVDVIAYNDVYEMLQDNVNDLNIGGPSRVVPIVKQMRATNPNSLALFASDTMSPLLWSSQFYGLQMVDAHNAIGVDYASLGNHEFDFGVDVFLNVSAASRFPWLNANCFELATGALLRGTTPRAIKVIETDSASLKKYIQRGMINSCGVNQELPLNGFYVHPSGFKYAFKCTGKAVGDVASTEWFKRPTRTGALLDTDTIKVALSNYLYTSEFFFAPDAVVRSVLVSEAEASRVDTALEVYVKAEGRSVVSF